MRGEGCYLYDEDGERYLDFIAQYGALPFGYNPTPVWTALEKVRLASEPALAHPERLDAAGELAQRLIDVSPAGLRSVTFTNSGSEAAEAAIKVCRAATGRLGILSATNGFHGATLGALSASGHPSLQTPFGAPVPHFDQVPYGDLAALGSVLREHPKYYAAFIIEPIQGKGGILDPPPGYLAGAEGLCRQFGVLFAVDEVQTGLGRTGRLFACQHDGIAPDVMILAKALGGGLMPIGACLYSEQAYSEDFEAYHSSTFAGNTLACRAGLATLEMLTANGEALIEQVDTNGRHLKEGLERLREKYPKRIKAVRGRGYMLGLEFEMCPSEHLADPAGESAESQPRWIQQVASHLLNVHRIRVAASSSVRPMLRLEPPLIAGREECSLLLEALDRTLEILR